MSELTTIIHQVHTNLKSIKSAPSRQIMNLESGFMCKLTEIINLFDEYLADTNIRIDRRQTNTKMIRLLDKNTYVRLNILWRDIFTYILEDKFDLNKLNSQLKDEINFGLILSEISRWQLYSMAERSRLTLWGTEVNFYLDRFIQGFYKKAEKYGEFIVEINTDIEHYYEFLDRLMSV